MAKRQWHDAVEILVKRVEAPPTEEMIALGETISVTWQGEPRRVYSAKLTAKIMPILTERPLAPITPRQQLLLQSLGHSDLGKVKTARLASAWIDHYITIQRIEALRHLQPMT